MQATIFQIIRKESKLKFSKDLNRIHLVFHAEDEDVLNQLQTF